MLFKTISNKIKLPFSIRFYSFEQYRSTHFELSPTELKLKKNEKRIEITFCNGEKFIYPAEYLRVKSPSADKRVK